MFVNANIHIFIRATKDKKFHLVSTVHFKKIRAKKEKFSIFHLSYTIIKLKLVNTDPVDKACKEII
jgi:hypothetical protein